MTEFVFDDSWNLSSCNSSIGTIRSKNLEIVLFYYGFGKYFQLALSANGRQIEL